MKRYLQYFTERNILSLLPLSVQTVVNNDVSLSAMRENSTRESVMPQEKISSPSTLQTNPIPSMMRYIGNPMQLIILSMA
jgi:hypothetical protein